MTDVRAARRSPPTRPELLGLAAATIAAFAVAVVFLGRREFWLDESFSYTVARQSWGELARFSFDRDGELNMALYYAVLKPFADTGASAWWLRLPSVLPIMATVPLVWLIADRIDGRRFVRVAAVALALTQPLLMSYAFETRAYGLLTLLTVGLTLLLVITLDGSRTAGVAYAVLLVVGVTLHLLVVVVAVAQLVAVLVVTDGPATRRLGRAVALTGPGLLAAGIAGFALVRFQGNLEHDDPVSLRSIASAVYAATGRAGPLTFLVLAAAAAGIVAVARGRGQPRTGWVVVLTVAIPPVLQLVAAIQRPVFSARYLVHLVPLLCCLVAVGLATVFAHRRARVAALATFVVLGVVGQAVIYRSPSDEIPDTASRFVVARTAPGDVIAFNSPNAQLPFRHHLDESGATGPRQVDQVTDPDFPSRMTELEPLPDALDGLDPGATVWVMEDRPSADRTDDLEDQLRGAGYAPVDRATFGEIVVQQWRRG